MSATAVSSYSSNLNLFHDNFDGFINLSTHDLRSEVDRLATFENNEWTCPYVNSDALARVGFYYFKRPDLVRCHFCGSTIGEFEAGDTALNEHLKWSPNCPLLKRRSTGNVPIDTALLDQILPPETFDVCGYTTRGRKSRADEKIEYSEYKLLVKRLKSFETWPVGIKQRPQELAEAGFFYNGHSDTTICFSCDLHLSRWEPEDNIWLEHKKHTKNNCEFLNLNHEIVKLNEQNYEELKENNCEIKLLSGESAESPKNEVQFESRCKVCLERMSSVLFLPCKHVAVCGQCVFGINAECPICRTPINERIKLYYA